MARLESPLADDILSEKNGYNNARRRKAAKKAQIFNLVTNNLSLNFIVIVGRFVIVRRLKGLSGCSLTQEPVRLSYLERRLLWIGFDSVGFL